MRGTFDEEVKARRENRRKTELSNLPQLTFHRVTIAQEQEKAYRQVLEDQRGH
jgi:hypothetical protein